MTRRVLPRPPPVRRVRPRPRWRRPSGLHPRPGGGTGLGTREPDRTGRSSVGLADGGVEGGDVRGWIGHLRPRRPLHIPELELPRCGGRLERVLPVAGHGVGVRRRCARGRPLRVRRLLAALAPPSHPGGGVSAPLDPWAPGALPRCPPL